MAELFELTRNESDEPLDREEIAALCADHDVLVPTVGDRINARIIAGAGERLRLIANFGAGIDHIDLAAARASRIIVSNTPGVFTEDTADMTLALMIGVSRRVREGSALIRSREWQGWSPSGMLGHSIGGKLLAIVGMGRIGQAVAHRARAFGLKIAYHNRRRLPAAVENMFGAEFVDDLNTLLARADIVTLHCPANPQTRHLIDARRIAVMKPAACLINTARAELVDEEALVTALQAGALGGAGLDVFAREPQIDERLLHLPTVITQPHLGSATVEGRTAAGERIIANIRFWADGHRPPDQVFEGWA